MIHVYLDDSGDEKSQQFAVCGGILGEDLTLTFTEEFWRQEVKDLKKPFRSTECECQHGQFKTWKKSDCDSLMARLVGVLNRTGMEAGVIGTAVPIPLFQKIFPAAADTDPYELAARHLLFSMVKIARARKERVKVWFEGGSTDAQALRSYNAVRDFKFRNPSERNRLAGIAFGDKSMYALQAADLAARETYKACANLGKRPIRKPLLHLWGHAGIMGFSEGCLVALRDAGGPLSIAAIDQMGPECHMRNVESTPYSQKTSPI